MEDLSDHFADLVLDAASHLSCRHRSKRRLRNGVAPCALCSRLAYQKLSDANDILTVARLKVTARNGWREDIEKNEDEIAYAIAKHRAVGL